LHRKSHSSSVLETDQRADGSCLKNMRHPRIYARVSCPELSDRRISADPCRRPFAASACQQSFTMRHVGAVRKQRGTRPPTATWSRSKLRSEQSVNNWLPDSRQWHVPSQAKPLKNQQDAAPALSYEPEVARSSPWAPKRRSREGGVQGAPSFNQLAQMRS
jgi:hypothetical protein